MFHPSKARAPPRAEGGRAQAHANLRGPPSHVPTLVPHAAAGASSPIDNDARVSAAMAQKHDFSGKARAGRREFLKYNAFVRAMKNEKAGAQTPARSLA